MFSLFQEIIWHEKGRKKLLLSFWQAASTITQYLVVLNHLSDRFFISLFNFAYIYSTFFFNYQSHTKTQLHAASEGECPKQAMLADFCLSDLLTHAVLLSACPAAYYSDTESIFFCVKIFSVLSAMSFSRN